MRGREPLKVYAARRHTNQEVWGTCALVWGGCADLCPCVGQVWGRRDLASESLAHRALRGGVPRRRHKIWELDVVQLPHVAW
jgi:hypothetical protein